MCEPETGESSLWASVSAAVAANVIAVVATLHCEYCDAPENFHSNYFSSLTNCGFCCPPHLPHHSQANKLSAGPIVADFGTAVNVERTVIARMIAESTFAGMNIAGESKRHSGSAADWPANCSRMNLWKRHCCCGYFAGMIVEMWNLVTLVAEKERENSIKRAVL